MYCIFYYMMYELKLVVLMNMLRNVRAYLHSRT